jgi:hypothetical protein
MDLKACWFFAFKPRIASKKRSSERASTGIRGKVESRASEFLDEVAVHSSLFRLFDSKRSKAIYLGSTWQCQNEWYIASRGCLNQTLGNEHQLPERNPSKLETVLTVCPSLEFIIDGTEPAESPEGQADRSIVLQWQRKKTCGTSVFPRWRKVCSAKFVVFTTCREGGLSNFLEAQYPGGVTPAFKAMPQKGSRFSNRRRNPGVEN